MEDESSAIGVIPPIAQPAVETINAPRLNPPSMADTNIETYFMSLEFWFAASGIGAQHDSRRYNIVMAQVPPNKLTELRSIVDATPANNKYAYIKTKLIAYFADSQQRRLQRVLSDMSLGDLKPSQLCNEMKRVAGSSLGEAVLLDLWATRLPPHAQAAVIASRGDATDKITIADAIVDSMVLRKVNVLDSNVQNSAMAAPKPAEIAAIDPIQDLKREIAELSRRLEKMLPNQNNFRDRSCSRSRGGEKRSANRERDSSSGPCWYHRTFGNDARRCRKPCSTSQQASSNQQ
nr:uncharacterized protein LOC115265003 [Aedes albopictus]